jgi:hypothetical protein
MKFNTVYAAVATCLISFQIIHPAFAASSQTKSHQPIAANAFSLDALNSGGMAIAKEDWSVRLRGSELRISLPREKDRTEQVQQEQIDVLRHIVDHSGFMDLHQAYGSSLVDANFCMLEISSGRKTHKVTISGYILSKPTKQEVTEIRRFMEVWKMIKQMAGLSDVENLCPDETTYPDNADPEGR